MRNDGVGKLCTASLELWTAGYNGRIWLHGLYSRYVGGRTVASMYERGLYMMGVPL